MELEALGESTRARGGVVRIALLRHMSKARLKLLERLFRCGGSCRCCGRLWEKMGPIRVQELGHREGGEGHQQGLQGGRLLRANTSAGYPLCGTEACVLHVCFDATNLFMNSCRCKHEIRDDVDNGSICTGALNRASHVGLRRHCHLHLHPHRLNVVQPKGDLPNHSHQFQVLQGMLFCLVVKSHVLENEPPEDGEELGALPVELGVDTFLIR
mmetsp:Transcript_83926/g.242654  ORF Transcript_83926/g.242654 Transcript_83926/m.242654 type:complete len:213 (-) Transcript_83926:471-1109(-)